MNAMNLPRWVTRLLCNQPSRQDAMGLCIMLLALGILLLVIAPLAALAWLGAVYLVWGAALLLAIRRADLTGHSAVKSKE